MLSSCTHVYLGVYSAYLVVCGLTSLAIASRRCVNKHTLERKAVKIIMKEDMRAEEKDLLRGEIAIMKLVNHPNIVRMEAVYESKKVAIKCLVLAFIGRFSY